MPTELGIIYPTNYTAPADVPAAMQVQSDSIDPLIAGVKDDIADINTNMPTLIDTKIATAIKLSTAAATGTPAAGERLWIQY